MISLILFFILNQANAQGLESERKDLFTGKKSVFKKYYDGCNYHTCSQYGECTSTLMNCLPKERKKWTPPKGWKFVEEVKGNI